MSTLHAELLRRAYPKVLAHTLAFTRNLPTAEDAVQEAMTRALCKWPETGVPSSPEAWLTTVAANVHRDHLRRGKWEVPAEDVIEALSQMSPWARIAVGQPEIGKGWKDDLLRLIFACCHPALETGESAALCLATVVGLSTREVALAFTTQPRTMEQRLARARKRLRELGNGEPAGSVSLLQETTGPQSAAERLPAVRLVIHLLFTEGYWSNEADAPIRADLCRLALGLARSLATEFPAEPEVLGLIALLLFHEARREARQGTDGSFIALPDQDRSRYDVAAIDEGMRWLHAAHEASRPGPLQLEAAISAAHCLARTANETDWRHIAELYAALEAFRPTPAVRVNRALAVARADGAEPGLRLLRQSDIDAESCPYVYLVRGSLLAELGRVDAARTELESARRVARNSAEQSQIGRQLAELNRGPKFAK